MPNNTLTLTPKAFDALRNVALPFEKFASLPVTTDSGVTMVLTDDLASRVFWLRQDGEDDSTLIERLVAAHDAKLPQHRPE